MKKILALALAAAMSLSLTACGGGGAASSKPAASSNPAASTPAASGSQGGDSSSAGGELDFGTTHNTLEEGVLRMATNCNFPPYEMSADGEGVWQGYEGIDIEIAVKLAEKLGLELVIDDMDFTSALLAVQSNKADMTLAGLTYRKDRDEVMDFSTSYATGIQVVIVTEDSDIASVDDLDGKKIGTQIGTTGYIYASDTPENGGYGEENVNGYDNGGLAVQALLNGQCDAVIIDNGPAKEYVKANPGTKILDGAWVTEDYCLAVDEGNAALLGELNTALEEMIADGTIKTIVDKYITE